MKLWGKHDPERIPVVARFKPQADITVYELAVILSKTMVQPVSFKVEAWEALKGDPILRHFA